LNRERFSGKQRLRQFNIEGLQFNAIDGRSLARDAIVVHRIDPVGGKVHLVERAIAGAEIEDAFNGNAAQGQVFGELGVRYGELGQIATEPLCEDLHANCPRKRISPEKNWPMSLTPYFIIAMRSMPMPKAKPEIFLES